MDELYMQRCFDLAKLGIGNVSPNPMVGAVLVHEGKIIGEGWHKTWGQAHAEVNCFQSVRAENQALIPHSTLYCSLEPCSHFGKTPPCADLVISKKIKRLVVANTDPNPMVAGKGIAKIKEAGIEVTEGVLEQDGAWLNRAFFTWIDKGRPFVRLKWAQSADGYLGLEGQKTAITGPEVQRLLHRWRSEVDAILVGANTATVDNPLLDTRLYPGRNPLRVLLDGNGSVPLDRHLLSDTEPTLVFGPGKQKLPETKTLVETSGPIDLSNVLEKLKQEKRASLLVEGGAQVLAQFFSQNLWDELLVFISPKMLGSGIPAPKIPPNAVLKEHFAIGMDQVLVYCTGA